MLEHSSQIVRVRGLTWLSARCKVVLFSVAYLLLSGIALSPLENQVWQPIAKSQPTLNLDELEVAAGQGVILGILGGMRSLVADVLWVEMYQHWYQRNYAATEAAIAMTVSADPRPVYFWSHGSRVIALDMAMWRINELGGYNQMSEEKRVAIFKEFGRKGLDFLKQAMTYHPDSIALLEDQAHINMTRMYDLEAAAEIYLRMYQLKNAPPYVPRIYAQLLVKIGRQRQAYEFLRQEYPKLPDVIFSQKSVVLQRIRDLEDELEIVQEERFKVERK